MRYILHYTEPGDVVYDGFCGTGMTGVAAQMCGNKAQVESLGYKVQADDTVQDKNGQEISRVGARIAILNDLSPAASFIAYNYNTPENGSFFAVKADRFLAQLERECSWLFTTLHEASATEMERVAAALQACSSLEQLREVYDSLKSLRSPLRDPNSNLQLGRIRYTVWSDVLVCSRCGCEIIFWNSALTDNGDKVLDRFACPSCRAETTKRQCSRLMSTHYDELIGELVTQAKQVLVSISYTCSKQRLERQPNSCDIFLSNKLDEICPTHHFPYAKLPQGENTEQPKRSHGITWSHHFYTGRNLHTFAAAYELVKYDPTLLFILTGCLTTSSYLYRWNPDYTGGGPQSGTYYIPALLRDIAALDAITRFVSKIPNLHSAKSYADNSRPNIGCASTTEQAAMPANSVSYIFTDPPFGGNIMYSELNFLWESWLGVATNNIPEAITSDSQKKGLKEYQNLMTRCFQNYYLVLMPGRWMTVEFHNSSNSVWAAIQEGLQHAGFVVADVRIIDKKQNSFKQATSAAAVKQDLVISCYKPRASFEQRFCLVRGKPEGVLEFVRQHLGMLPVAPVSDDGRLEPVAERRRFLLFDRMIAYHLQRNAPIPLDSSAFYTLLEDQFTIRDEMYFLPDQAARYDALRASGIEAEQLSIFVQDEKTCVQWLRTELTQVPQTLGDLTPKFMQELREWPEHEPRPELRDLLREYFIQSGADIWRVPKPDDERDIAALRQSALIKLFQGYAREKGPLRTFRKEAVVEGFKECYETKQFSVIVSVSERIPENVFQEIPEFVMFYDIAKDLAPGQIAQPEFVWE